MKSFEPLSETEYAISKNMWRECYKKVVKPAIEQDYQLRDDPAEMIYLYLKSYFEKD